MINMKMKMLFLLVNVIWVCTIFMTGCNDNSRDVNDPRLSNTTFDNTYRDRDNSIDKKDMPMLVELMKDIPSDYGIYKITVDSIEYLYTRGPESCSITKHKDLTEPNTKTLDSMITVLLKYKYKLN